VVLRVEPATVPGMVQNPEYDALTMKSGQRRNTEIHFPVRQPKPCPAVLGLAPFGDVEARHDFYATHDCCPVLIGQLGHFLQDSVEPIPDAQSARERLHVNVARSQAQCVEHQHVHELDDWRLIRERFEIVESEVGCVR